MKRALYDTNVLLDVLLQREPHYAASAAALDAVEHHLTKGYVAAHAVTTLDYLLCQAAGAQRSRVALTSLLEKLQVAPVTDEIIRSASNSEFRDFEDAVCHAAAQAVEANIIVTRNPDDFTASIITVMQPTEFCEKIYDNPHNERNKRN
ncbi:MAG: PIN domain-containing protein [Gammaproteobacteria bacterium]|nr:PIN domain-containing protein [Gammaproteobacteria bacterium]